MPVLDQTALRHFIEVSAAAATTTEQGRALEQFICRLFDQIPGIAITHRNEMNVFRTEEIDVALWNDGFPDGLSFLPDIILVECKNWSKRVGSEEVSWFREKLRDRGLDFGILITTQGITGNPEELTGAQFVIAKALAAKCRLLVLKTEELLYLHDTDALILLIKRKLCDLAVRGAIG
jgi:hypothetical protein